MIRVESQTIRKGRNVRAVQISFTIKYCVFILHWYWQITCSCLHTVLCVQIHTSHRANNWSEPILGLLIGVVAGFKKLEVCFMFDQTIYMPALFLYYLKITKQRCQLVRTLSTECCSKSKFFPRGNSEFNIELSENSRKSSARSSSSNLQNNLLVLYPQLHRVVIKHKM
jgi:hypothetical protein